MWEEEEKKSLNERRNSYKCGKGFVSLENIETFDQTLSKLGFDCFEDLESLPKSYLGQKIKLQFEHNEELNKKICTWQGDITTLEIDGILNAANTRLLVKFS